MYRIGTYEVSRDMVMKANAEVKLNITMPNFPTGPRIQLPATEISWNEAARFVNWLNTSQGFPAAYKFAKQPGEAGYNANDNIQLWTSTDPGFDPANQYRNTQARYFLPSVNEWYKAAYYDPNANNGAGGYWRYPTGSNRAPASTTGGTKPETAVYSVVAAGPADVDQAGGLTPYGAMGMAGNVYEWQETSTNGLNNNPGAIRLQRGGAWNLDSSYLSVNDGGFAFSPDTALSRGGLRIASVPEPGLGATALLGIVGLMLRRRRHGKLSRS